MEKYKSKRRLYRLFLQPKFQLKFGLYFTVLAASSLMSSFIVTVFLSMRILAFAQGRPQSEDILHMAMGFVFSNPIGVISSLVFMSLFYFFVAVLFSKSVAGPVRVLVSHIEALKNGDYHRKTNLRQGDDLKELMTSLNQLSDVLNEKYPPEQSKAS